MNPQARIWDSVEKREVDTPKDIIEFLSDYHELCKKYNMSIAHEDIGGGFEIHSYKEDNIEWLFACSMDIE